MPYDLGDTVSLAFDVRDATGALVNAETMTVTVGLPDGTSAVGSVANPPASVGHYVLDYVPTQPGRHTIRAVSTTPALAYSDLFDVRPAAPAYIVSLADAKAHLNLPASSTTNDEELRGWIEACTEVVEELAGEVVVRRTVVEARTFDHVTARFALHAVPVISLTSITDLNGSATWTAGGFHVDPGTGVVSMLTSGSPLHGLVQLTYVAGYQIIPATYTRAALMVLRHLWSTQRAALGGSARSTRLGGMEGDDSMMIAGYSVPRAAVELIGPPVVGIA